MKKTYLFLTLLMVLVSCSNFDEKEFTVLLPDAGIDQILFTEEAGTIIQLDASASSDVNNIGFDYEWKIVSSPDGFPVTILNSTNPNPTFEVSNEASGRYELSVELSIGDQTAIDFVNIDVNPALAEVLFVNAIDSEETAILRIPSIDFTEDAVASKNTNESYINVDTNISIQEDGTTLFEVVYNGNIISLNGTIEALKSYTLYLVGTEEFPELLLKEKNNNQNTIGVGFVGLEAINLVPETSDVVLFIDANAVNFGILPLDTLFGALGVSEQIGALEYQENGEISLSSFNLLPLPIYATINGARISNDTAITISSGEDGSFGTFMCFPDASSVYGHTLLFIENSSLLPQ